MHEIILHGKIQAKKKNKIWRFLLAKEEEKNVENQQTLIPRRLILLL